MRTLKHKSDDDLYQKGYSLLEALVVCLVGIVLMAVGAPIYKVAVNRSNADGAVQLIAQEMSYARAMAVGSHRSVLFQLSSTDNSVVVAPGSGQARGPFILPGGMRLRSTAFSTDTPDGLGSTVLGPGSSSQLSFLDNGSVVDNPASNNIISGTIFLESPDGEAGSRRALTLMGGTGRIHIWRYDSEAEAWR